jgi:SAM-dependent methyltransferase
LYDHIRTGYAPEVMAVLRDACQAGAATRIIEIGPGTGQMTRGLLNLDVAHVTAIEPDHRLAEFLSHRHGQDPRVTVVPARFEDVDLPNANTDLIVAATSFHWLNARSGLAKAKAALRSGGWWFACWHIFNDPTVDDPFRAATAPIFQDVGRVQQDDAKGSMAFGLDSASRQAELRGAGFIGIEMTLVRQTLVLDTAAICALYGTFSPITTLNPEAKAWFMGRLERLMHDEFGGTVERPLLTPVYWAQKP